MKQKIIAIIGLNLALPLLFGGFCAYAGTEMAASGEITPSIVYIDVLGDEGKFAEDHWIKKSVTGGIGDYSYINENKRGDYVVAEGRGLAGNGDYLFNFDLKREGVGSLIFEFKQFNKYYDGTGGYYSRFANLISFSSPLLETQRDLLLDIGNLKVEAIFSKDDSTKCIFSYEREYRKGAKSLISWGTVNGVVNGVSTNRKILPTFLETDEIVDKLELKIEHTVNGIDVSAEQTWEKIKIESQKVNNRTLTLATGRFSDVRYKYEDLDSDIYTTIVRISKELNEKVFFSTAFLYNYYRGHTKERITDQGTSTNNENHPLNPANVYQSTVTVLPKVSISLMEHLFMDAGFRWEWIDKNSKARYDRDKGTAPDGNRDELLYIDDDISDQHLGETISFKFDGIRDVVFYADGELEQQIRNEDNTQNSAGSSATTNNNFVRDTDTATYDFGYTIGAKAYPMPKVDVTAEFKYKYGVRDYKFSDHDIQTGDITNGYRGFIQTIAYTTYKPVIMCNLKPFRWIACNFRYALDTTIYGVRTGRASAAELAQYTANIYSAGATLMPKDDLYLTFFYHYKQASTETQANGNGGKTSGVNQPTYNANVKALSASCTYSLVKDVTVRGSYTYSRADNFNDFSQVGLPLGLDNFSQDASIGIERKICTNCSLEFKYDFTQYNETSNAGIDNYEAHLFYTALKSTF